MIQHIHRGNISIKLNKNTLGKITLPLYIFNLCASMRMTNIKTYTVKQTLILQIKFGVSLQGVGPSHVFASEAF
jgi:hypothetical protein